MLAAKRSNSACKNPSADYQELRQLRRLQDEDQQIDVPNAINEGQHQRDGRPHDHGGYANICNHLDRKRSSEHGTCFVARDLER
jgi:hypothetical protein